MLTTALIGLMNVVVGWVLGIGSSFLLDYWRNRGKVTVATTHTWKRGSPDWNEAAQYVFHLTFRAFNTFPSEKNITVVRVDFHHEVPTGMTSSPAFTDEFPKIGYDIKNLQDQDIVLPPKSSTRLSVSAFTPHQGDHRNVSAEVKRVGWVVVEFLVLPDTRFRETYDMAEAVDMENERNHDLVRMKLL